MICEALCAAASAQGPPPADPTGIRVCVCKREGIGPRWLLSGARLRGFPIENDAPNGDHRDLRPGV